MLFNIFKSAKITSFACAMLAIATPSIALAETNTKTDLDRIVEEKVIRVGAIEAAPWYHQDLLTNKWVGIVPETAEAVFGTIGVKVEYVPTEWGTAVAGLQSNKFDIVGAYTATPARGLVVDFSNSVGIVPTGFVTIKPEIAEIKSWDDLNKPEVKIAAVDGAATTRGVEKLMPNATWILVKTNDAMLLEVESGRADLAISNQPTLMQYVEAKNNGHIVLPSPARGTTAPFAMRKTTGQELANWMNLSMEYLRADGVLQQIWEKYLPTQN